MPCHQASRLPKVNSKYIRRHLHLHVLVFHVRRLYDPSSFPRRLIHQAITASHIHFSTCSSINRYKWLHSLLESTHTQYLYICLKILTTFLNSTTVGTQFLYCFLHQIVLIIDCFLIRTRNIISREIIFCLKDLFRLLLSWLWILRSCTL